MYKKEKLDNGLRLITVPKKGTKAVTVLVLVGAGSKYETKETKGISHLLEHMFFKGTKKRPSPLEVSKALDGVGGTYNAFTGEEYTGYYAKVEKSQLETAIEWVSDIFLNSTFPEQEMEKEKGVVVEEINMYNDTPMENVRILWPKLLYGDQPAGWNIAGSKESVRNIKRKNLLNYRENQYVGSNTIVCIAGNIDNGNAKKLTKKYFAGVKKGKAKDKTKVKEKQEAPQILLENQETDQTHFCLGVRGYDINSSQKYSTQVLSNTLGGMMSSRLFVKIRGELGLAYYVKTSASSQTDTGYLVTRIGADNKKAEKAVEAVLNEYKRIRDEGIEDQELTRSKENIKGNMALSLESSDRLGFFYAKQELLKDNIETPDDIYKKIDEVDPKKIDKVTNDIFQPSGLNLAMIGPFNNKQGFKKILNKF